MISKQELIDSLAHEVKIIQHLSGKLTDEHMSYRPTPGQRSTLELLQYLTHCALTPVINAVTDNWDHAQELGEAASKVKLSNFSEAMDTQLNEIKEILKEPSDSFMANKDATMPWGAPVKAGAALMNMPLKCLVAYRMQLFLYMRSLGIEGLSTANNWAGVAMPAAQG